MTCLLLRHCVEYAAVATTQRAQSINRGTLLYEPHWFTPVQRHLILACNRTYCVSKSYRESCGCICSIHLSCLGKHVQYRLCDAALLYASNPSHKGIPHAFAFNSGASCCTTARSQTIALPASAATTIKLFRHRTRFK